MKYTVLLMAALTLLMMALPMGATAQEDGHKGDGIQDLYEESPQGCMGEMPGRMPVMMHLCDGMGPHAGMPFEGPWHAEMPRRFMQHMDDSRMNLDAMRYMNSSRTIMILPFGDYTTPTYEGDALLEDAGGPMRIVDNLAAVLMSRGYLVIPPRDVESAYLGYSSPNVHSRANDGDMPPELENNNFYFREMPDRAMDFYQSVVPGLNRHEAELRGIGSTYMTSEDIVALAETFHADAVIRGFINEFALADDIDADLRTFLPPFLGLFNPDKRATVEISYYLYDGHSGELIWNSTIEMQKNTNWPLFDSDEELLRTVEHDVVWAAAEMFLPNWMEMVWGHPEWVPFEMWEHMDCEPYMMMEMYRPDWLNPLRDGWHDEYLQGDWDINCDEYKGDPYDQDLDISHNYNLYRRYLEMNK